jgi:acyl dehydratase
VTQSPSFADVNVGDAIPSLDKPAIDRVQLALYAGGSGDHNAIHLDDDRAKSGGLPGVIAHGMLSMAFLGELVGNWVPQSQIREFGGRFASIVKPGDVVTCGGTIKAKDTINGENRVEVEIHAETGDGNRAIVGKAVVALP